MRKFSLALLLTVNLFAAEPIQPTIQELSWPNGDTFLTFLEKNSIPLSLYYDMDSDDKEFVSEIKAGISYQILRDEKGGISQVLIPVNEELQAQIYKDNDGKYNFQLSSISYQTHMRVLSMPITVSPSQDIQDATGSAALAHGFYLAMKSEVPESEFKKLKKGDRLAMEYTQKTRLGRTFGMPEIHWASIQIGDKKYVTYKFENKYYDKSGKKNDKFLLTRPIANARITSPFTPKRYHPILKRYKAHLGVDYGAPKGTPIKAAGDGTVKFVGTKSGYGKVVIVGHVGGYETLYAHSSGFAKGIQSGVKVKQGQLIAYVGSTGMSTGSHLHFGVYKNGNAINPENEIKVAKNIFAQTENAKFQKYIKQFETKIKDAATNDEIPEKEEKFGAVSELGEVKFMPKADENLTATDEKSVSAGKDANLTEKTEANETKPDENLTNELKIGAEENNATKAELNLTAKTDVNLTSEVKSQDEKDVNLTKIGLADTNLTVKSEQNLTDKTDVNASQAVNLAAAKAAKTESSSASQKEKNKKTDSKKSSKNAKDKEKSKSNDKKKEKSKSESKKKKDVNASKDKSKKQKESADKKAKSKDKTAESSDKKSK